MELCSIYEGFKTLTLNYLVFFLRKQGSWNELCDNQHKCSFKKTEYWNSKSSERMRMWYLSHEDLWTSSNNSIWVEGLKSRHWKTKSREMLVQKVIQSQWWAWSSQPDYLTQSNVRTTGCVLNIRSLWPANCSMLSSAAEIITLIKNVCCLWKLQDF